MSLQMIGHEGLDEVVVVAVAGMEAELHRLADLHRRLLEEIGMQLLGQELVVQSLVDQDLGMDGWFCTSSVAS